MSWKIIFDPKYEKWFKQMSPQTEKLFQKMVKAVEKNGFGKKWCFGPFHEVYPEMYWVPQLNQTYNYVSHLNSPQEINPNTPIDPNQYIHLILEESPSKREYHVKYMCLPNKQSYDAGHKWLDEHRIEYKKYPKRTRPLYNFDESQDGAQDRHNNWNGVQPFLKVA